LQAVLVPVYTKFGYGRVDLTNFESLIQQKPESSQIVKVTFSE